MIKIEAVVRPERVNIVLESMAEAGCTGFTYTNVSGRGTQEGVEVFTGRGSSTANRVSVPKVLITAVTDKSNQKKVVDAILNSAKTTETWTNRRWKNLYFRNFRCDQSKNWRYRQESFINKYLTT